ncbi:MAG: Xaa-Pro dipeptidase [Gammaproteobacteria bacterium]|nr:Xaa-Pro dipeptidase [Gammaproteobacteria bacterium]MDH5303357.1 Xaa-Pro dipeptidase [Gammaproteobacteria bacterium]
MKHGMIVAMNNDYSDQNTELAGLYPAHLDTVRQRHDHALDKAGASHAVIFSGSSRYVFLDDMAYTFKPNAHFVSWLPLLDLPLSYIVYTPGEVPRLIYYQPRDYWHVVPGEPEGYWTGQFDIRVVHSIEEVAAHLPGDRQRCILIGEINDAAHAFGIDRVNPTTALNILHYGRGIKTGYELACMRLSTRRAVAGHLAAAAAFREGKAEFDIHRAYCQAVSHTDSELPYGNIIALNEHSAVLHYTHLDRQPPRQLRSFLIDAGAQVHGYAADITRTYAHKDSRFAELIARLDELQLRVVQRVQAGIDYVELHIETHRLLSEVLVDAKLARGSAETLVETGVTAAFLPHGLGHLLGIQVHDVGGHMQGESGAVIDPPSGHPYLRLTRVLEENMTLTIEPGLYVIDMLLDKLRDTAAEDHVLWDGVEWLRPFGGIRIEDNVRVLANGRENLTRDAFSAAA